MMNLFEGKRILLGVTGSIACYKAADLASKLSQVGAEVDVVLTPAALNFISPLTFQSVTGRRAYVESDLWGSEGHVLHIELARQADLIVIAPASANTLAKLAQGLADNLLTITALAARCPLIVAPAMDGGMYNHPATQANLTTLRQRGASVVGPAQGHLASGLVGIGRLVDVGELLGSIRLVLGRSGPLFGRRVLVTAAGTQEPIDPVRSITNRSSGKQGFALAQAALDMGATVTLVSGPSSLPTPTGALRVDVRTAQEMLNAVLANVSNADVLLMAAAVADFRPEAPASQKIKKENGVPEIKLVANPDILTTVARVKAEHGYPEITVGFAAESKDLLANAQSKLKAKQMDLIVANDISAADAGFNVDTNRVTLLDASGETEALPLMSKTEVAQRVLERVARMLRLREIVHICRRAEWDAARTRGEYRAASLETEGFIHASRPEQVLKTANRYYHGVPDLVLLYINPRNLRAELRWEPAHDDTFPHIYGPINLDAVLAVRNFDPDEDGTFRTVHSL